MRHLALLLLAAVLMVVAGCGGSDEPTTWEKDGRAVGASVIESYRGDDHCGWDEVTFLAVGWPLGTASDGTSRQYVRDPDGVVADKTLAEYQPSASLPDDAEDTGYSGEIGELWLVPENPDLAYIVSGEDDVEAWPRTRQLLGCD